MLFCPGLSIDSRRSELGEFASGNFDSILFEIAYLLFDNLK